MNQLAPDTNAALKMLAAFVSVGVRAFDITLKNLEGAKVGFQSNRSVEEIRQSIGKRLEAATASRCNVIIRPRPDANLIQLDDLDSVKAAKVAPHAFLIFETSPGNFQAWVSLSAQVPLDLARRLKRGAGADVSASGATRIAGSYNFKSKYAPEFPRVEITQSVAGRVTTPAALEFAGLLAEAEQPPRRVSALVSRQYHGLRKWPDYGRNLAAAPRTRDGQPDRSNADFVWCMTAIDWGWSVEATAARLLEVSEKAKERVRLRDEGYPLVTARSAAEAVARNRAAKAHRPG
jgi:hypothetical protein